MPRPRWVWPVTIVAGNRAIRVTLNAVTETVLITTGAYHVTGALVNADDLLREVRDALDTHTQVGAGWAVTMSTVTGRITISHAAAWTILWADSSPSVATTFDGEVLGFDISGSTVGALVGGVYTATSPWQAGNTWHPQRLARERTLEAEYAGGAQTWTIGDVLGDVIHTTTPRQSREVIVPFVFPFFVTYDRSNATAYTVSGMTVGDPNAPILNRGVRQTRITDRYNFFEAAARGVAMRYYADITVTGTYIAARLLWPNPDSKRLVDIAAPLENSAGQYQVTIRQRE